MAVKRSSKVDLVLRWAVVSLSFCLFALWLVWGQPDWLRFLIVALVALYFLVIRVVLNLHRLKVLNEEPADPAAAAQGNMTQEGKMQGAEIQEAKMQGAEPQEGRPRGAGTQGAKEQGAEKTGN